MKKFLLTMFFSVAIVTINYAKVEYLKVEFMHLVLVTDDKMLVNDSIQLSVFRSYFMKGFRSKDVKDYHLVDSVVEFIMQNQKFFEGLSHKDIETLLGESNEDYYMKSYRMARWDMKAPRIKTILFLRFRKGRVSSIQAPYNAYCCSVRQPKRKIWQWLSPRKPEIWPEE